MCDMGVNGGGLGGFGGDIDGFGGCLRGLGVAAFGSPVLGVRCLDVGIGMARGM